MRKQSVLRKKTQVLQVVTLQTVFGEQGSGLLRGWFGQRTVLKMAVSERDFPSLPGQRHAQCLAFVGMKQAIAQVTPTGEGLPRTWGSWKGKDPALGRWPKSGHELDEWIAAGTWDRSAQDEHICTVKIPFGARERQFTFMWMPHPVRSVPQKIEDKRLYDSETLERLRSIVRN